MHESKIMHQPVRVYQRDLDMQISLVRAFAVGLQRIREEPAILERARAIRLTRKDTLVSSLRITATQYYNMRVMCLNPGQVIQIGFEMMRHQLQSFS